MKISEIIFLTTLLVLNSQYILTCDQFASMEENLYDNQNKLFINNVLTYELSPKPQSIEKISLIQEEKETPTPHTDIVQNLTRRATEYSGKVYIGNPPQEFEMVFDTGSANFIITSSKCKTIGCRGHRKYNADKSSSSRVVKQLSEHSHDYRRSLDGDRDEVFIRFGTGSIKSYLTEDKVCIGENKNNTNFCVENFLMLEAYEESEDPFSIVKFDGILGLSFSHLSVNYRANYLDMLVNSGKIKEKIFSFYFNRDDSGLSQIHIGGINKDKIKTRIYFSDVISKNYWEIKIDRISYGPFELLTCQKVACTAIIDTGTSMIAAPSPIIQELRSYSNVHEDCSNMKSLLNLKFEINGAIFNLEPKYYIMKISDEVSQNQSESPSRDDLKCMNAFMTINALSSRDKYTILLGTPFLKKYYTVFDRERGQIGFAVAKHDKKLE